jgi:chemotaxis protein methyltransferase CheR
MHDAHSIPAMLQEGDLAELRALVESRTGMALGDAPAFAACVARHLRERGLSLSALLRRVRQARSEFQELLDCLFTPSGSFFQHPELFAALREKILPELHMKKFWETPRRLRIWSAGCGSGEEAYSLAITVADAMEPAESWDVRIFASDISDAAVRHARRGVYPARSLAALLPRRVEAHFARVGEQYMVRSGIRHMVSFATFNLCEPVYTGQFDCIFCTAVLPALLPGRRPGLLRAFHSYLALGGYLLVSHPGLLSPAAEDFQPVEFAGARLFQKPAVIPMAADLLTEPAL